MSRVLVFFSVENRRYLSASELGLESDTKAKDVSAGGKKYLSADELASFGSTSAAPQQEESSRGVMGRVVLPKAANKHVHPGEYEDGDVDGTLVSLDLDDLDGPVRESSPNDTLMNIPGVSVAQTVVPTTANMNARGAKAPVAEPEELPVEASVAVPVAAPVESSRMSEEAEEPKTPELSEAPRAPLRRSSSSGVLELSPMSEGVLAYLDAHLPEEINFLPESECRAAVEKLRTGGEYSIGGQLARGAESLLYQGKCGDYNFLVKSIRNWRDHWIGDTRTRKDTGKLSEGVEYATKMRHLNNEWAVGQALRDDSPNPVPVQIYSLRRVTRMGLELGWDLLMERINGIDLSDKKLIATMTLADKVRICIRMAQAVSILHSKKLIHLDIKPSNFLLDRGGNLRMIDFGISVASGYLSRTVAGTAGYFSPEQISCKALNEDTDVFALGVTYNVLFGGRLLMQTPDEAKSRQYRHDAGSDLEKSNLPAVGEIPELKGPNKPLGEVIRACTICRRVSRISNCAALITKLRMAADECGIQL